MEEYERKLAIQDMKKAEKLLQNKEFVDIILGRYMKESIHDLMYREGSSDGVLKGIDARKSLNDFIYSIIEDGKLAEEIK